MQPVSRMMGAGGEWDKLGGSGGEETAGKVEGNGEAIVRGVSKLVATGLSFSVRAVVPLGHWLVAGVESGGRPLRRALPPMRFRLVALIWCPAAGLEQEVLVWRTLLLLP